MLKPSEGLGFSEFQRGIKQSSGNNLRIVVLEYGRNTFSREPLVLEVEVSYLKPSIKCSQTMILYMYRSTKWYT